MIVISQLGSSADLNSSLGKFKLDRTNRNRSEIDRTVKTALKVRRRRTNTGFLKCRIPYDVSGICSDVQNKARKLLHLFEQFDMHNIIDEPTRKTPKQKH